MSPSAKPSFGQFDFRSWVHGGGPGPCESLQERISLEQTD